MNPQYHIAFCNVTFTEYAGVSYRDYYGSPAVMLETQLAAKDYAERRWGVGGFITPLVDSPSCALASYLGMPVIEPDDADELPYLDSSRPVLRGLADADSLVPGDPRTSGSPCAPPVSGGGQGGGLMARRWEAWQYYRAHGYAVGFGGCGGEIMTLAGELSSGAAFGWLAEDPAGGDRLLDKMVEVQETLASFGASLAGEEYRGFSYVGDDFAGLMSPAMYRRFLVPCYQRLYAGNERRFLHSELLRAEHLLLSRDEVGITEFHGAGCKLLKLQAMYRIMGHRFWTQLTPQEMLELTPGQISDRVSELANCGAGWFQLYPGRNTPEANLEAALAAAQRECPGGPRYANP
jgi:hypothetical protein